MTASVRFWRRRGDGIEICVRLTPKSAQDAIDGVLAAADGSLHLKARVRAVPEKGKANDALERLIAGYFGVPAGSVKVVAGRTSRLKTVRISGDPDELAGRSEKLVLH